MKRFARRVAARLPGPARRLVDRARHSRRLRRRLHPIRWGNLRRLEPVSAWWGSERGTPVDRYYIDRFFAANASLIRDRVIEVGADRYTSRFGQGVTSLTIVDIDARNDAATLIADLAEEGSLPAAAYDCAVIPQTLLFVSDPVAAVRNLWRSLAPGGALLVSTPAISRVAPEAPEQDRWHLTAPGLGAVLSCGCDGATAAVEAFGNPVTAIAFLHGIVQEDLRADELAAHHPLFPIVVTGVVRKDTA